MNTDVKWIGLCVGLFDDSKIKLIRSMPDGAELIICWLQLLCMAGKVNNGGYVYITQSLPCNEDMLATMWGEKKTTVVLALKVFKDLGMIDIEADGKIFVENFFKYQEPLLRLQKQKDATRERVAAWREKQKELPQSEEEVTVHNNTIQGNGYCNGYNTVTKPITTIPQRSLNILQDSKIERKTIQWLESNYPVICELCKVQTFENGKGVDQVLESLACIYEQNGGVLPITLPEMLKRAKAWRPKSENSKKNGLAGWIKGGLWLSTSTATQREETHAEKMARVNRECEGF